MDLEGSRNLEQGSYCGTPLSTKTLNLNLNFLFKVQ
jgi:hypothetical protein